MRRIGRKSIRVCRSGFPGKVQDELTFNSMAESVKSRRRGKKVLKLYDLPRRKEEQFVNPYNPALLLMWGANMDIQFVGENNMVLNR